MLQAKGEVEALEAESVVPRKYFHTNIERNLQ